MKNKKRFLVIGIIIILYFIRQGYYHLGYLNVMNNAVSHVNPEYINAEEKDYIQNESFEEITLDTKTVTDENLKCEKNDNDTYISQGIINYSCKKENILILYNSGKDEKLNYEEENIVTYGDKVPFYKYEVKSKDIKDYLNKNNIERVSELMMEVTKTDYFKVGFFSMIKDIKEATTYNLLKSISIPNHYKTYIITSNQKEFRVYYIANKHIVESTLDERGFYIILEEIPNITIEKIVNLIGSINFLD